MRPFTQTNAQLHAELRWLDLLFQRQIRRFRAERLGSMDEFRGLYVSDPQVDALLRAAVRSGEALSPDIDPLGPQCEPLPPQNASHAGPELPLQCLAKSFGFDEFERSVLLLAAAPELDLRYEVLCSYLNNDVTRKRPTVDLAMRLFAPADEHLWEKRRHFTLDAPLFRFGLLQWLSENPEIPASSLARAFYLPPRVVNYLLDLPGHEAKLAGFTEEVTPAQEWDDLLLPPEFVSSLRGATHLLEESPTTVLLFEGLPGAGKRACAEALCAAMGRGLLVVDTEGLMAANTELPEAFMLLAREQRLSHAGIYLRGAKAFFDHDGRLLPKARSLTKNLACCLSPLIFGCAEPCDWKALLSGIRFHAFHVPKLPFDLRKRTWQRELTNLFGHVNGADVDSLANQFVLTGGQIREAVISVQAQGRLRERQNAPPSRDDLFAAARAESTQQLRSLAQRIEPVYAWKDLVLPAAAAGQLHEIERALRYRHVVFDQWGFEERLSLGKGVKALFAGASGTGKTMAAEVLARELGLDLYKIDLASVVSKYIGETEKNLDRIFRAAQSSNAILFFDEADALFGKRSATKDAHDRYANIEVAYLLQKTEEYEGFVILATNLMQNLDEAFKRRINYVVEFPFPDEIQRERLWRSMFPPQTPLGDGLDFAFLSRQFALTGGNIKNAALSAAFFAAADGGAVQMGHLVQAVAREWQKLGKLPSAADFKQYYDSIKALPVRSSS